MLLLVQTQIVAGDLRDAAYVADEALVVLLQMSLEELVGLEALAAQRALTRPLRLVHFDRVLAELLLVGEALVALLAAHLLLVAAYVLKQQLLLDLLLAAERALVNRTILRGSSIRFRGYMTEPFRIARLVRFRRRGKLRL